MSQVYQIAKKAKADKQIVCIGHLDHGKSTLLGRLFYDSGLIDKKVLARAKKSSRIFGQKKFDFAYLMDSFKEERARGITIGLGHKKLETPTASITFGDAPGHHDFLKNMLVGAAESDAALLVVAVDEGPQRQTEEHLFLAKMLGLPQVIIAVNKMDLVDYKQKAFREGKRKVVPLIKKVGYFPGEVPVIPVSALYGQNITKKSSKMVWFKGPTILGAIEKLPPRQTLVDLPVRFLVQDLYPETRAGKNAVVGRLVSGEISQNSELVVWPLKKKFRLERLFIQDRKVKKAVAGDNVYFYSEDFKPGIIKRGQVLTFPHQPPTITEKFSAQLIVFDVPEPVKKSFRATFSMLTQSLPCRIEKVKRKIDTATGTTIGGKSLNDNQAGEVLIETSKPVFIESQSQLPCLAKFQLKLKHKVIGMGICTKIRGDNG